MMTTLATHTRAEEVGICWCPTNHPEPPPDVLEAIAERGVTLHRIPPPFLSPRYAVRLARVVAQLRPDVLHLHGATIGIVGGVVGRALRVPAIVYTEHLEHAQHAGWLRRAREMAADLPHRTVFVSERSYRQAVRDGPLRSISGRASVIPNGIDLSPYRDPVGRGERERMRAELGLRPDTLAIGCVGLLWWAKGQEYLVRAVGRLRDLPGRSLLLVGSGEGETAVREAAKQAGVAERVHFLGWRSDVPRILQALDIYAQPSLTEGLPLAVVEAAAAGLPIVASDVGGIPEIIEHGVNGLLVPPGDAQALADAIQQLIDDPQRARQLGEAARRTAFERFSAEAMAAAYMELYERLLREKR
jgi:glycosyltransferase involved in cell wall biosynthesis